jgi:putative salt-induced outer membrane protein
MTKICIWIALGLTFASVAIAEEEEGPWSGTVSFGYLATSGNTDNQSYNGAAEVSYTRNKWTHKANASAIGAAQSNTTTAEAYQAGWKSEYAFNEYDFLFGLVDWRKDRFSGFDQQLSGNFGYGRRLIKTEKQMLSVEAGLGYRTSDLSDGTTESSAIGRGGLNYTWAFSETSKFDQALVIEAGSDNTFYESVSAVHATLIGDLALGLSFTVRHNSDPPIGNDNTDTFTAISLEYAF